LIGGSTGRCFTLWQRRLFSAVAWVWCSATGKPQTPGKIGEVLSTEKLCCSLFSSNFFQLKVIFARNKGWLKIKQYTSF